MKPEIDLNDTSNFRQAGGTKKAKKAQKEADQAKWADDGDGGNKDEAGGEKNGDEAGGSNNGDGGAGDGSGGGDDWNAWDTGKKKKGKKAKEEEKKKQEEEKTKKLEEEEERKTQEGTGNGDNPLSWVDEDPGDEWGSLSPKKDKKAKKGKVFGKDASCLYSKLILLE